MWQDNNKWLTANCILMLALLVANAIGLMVDPRLIAGSPAWLKPAKFSLSTALYAGTLAWILSKVTVWPSFVKALGRITTLMLFIEIAIINLQAWRGTTSHFNFKTSLDASLFGTMGISVAILWLASVAILIALFREQFANRTLGWALRLGMLITVIGSGSGGLMTHPMPGQAPGVIGSHTVGGPDGGVGMAGTGWSVDHGDLRIGHFVGLHGMQVIPLMYWFIARRRRPSVAQIGVAAASYLGIAVLLEWQALRGQSIFHPDSMTSEAWLLWVAISVSGLFMTSLHGRSDLVRTSESVA